MRLISATVRNYRLHRECCVEFDAARTVIGGANECGKSTLAEAIHRALFFPAKSGADPQKRMRSTVHAGHPEVEVVFEARGRRYHLKKRFSGPNGTATLTPAGRPALSGSDAESELARLLGVSGDVSAKASVGQWSHLWVEQGTSTDDPVERATTQRDALLARLQSLGGAAAMQSERDARIANHFAAAASALFIAGGKPKAGSALERATRELQDAEAAFHEADQRVLRLQQAVDDLENARTRIVGLKQDLTALDAERTKLNERHECVTVLERTVADQSRAAKEAAETFRRLESAHRSIVELQAQIQALRAEFAPAEAQGQRLESSRLARQQQASECERQSRASTADARAARLRHDLARTAGTLLEKQAQLADVLGRIEQARTLEEESERLREAHAKLPAIDGAALKKLQKLSTRLAEAEAALAAMATTVELVASEVPATLGSEALPAGSSRVITDETDLAFGSSIRVRIRPGGTTLADARHTQQELANQLQAGLDEYAVPTLTAAVEAVQRRDHLASEISTIAARIADLKLSTLLAQQTSIETACAAVEAELRRRQTECPDFIPATEFVAARAAVTAAEQAHHAAEALERKHQLAFEEAAKAFADASDALEKHTSALAERRNEIRNLEVRLGVLIEQQGDDAARAAALFTAREHRNSTAAALAGSQTRLSDLQPELLTGSISRNTRAIEEKNRAHTEAEKQEAAAQSLLMRDETVDPLAEREQAEARLRATQDRYASARAHADAIKLLDQLFRDEQRALADQFTQPLADRVSAYLQCLFGPGSRAVVRLQDNTFSGLELVRPAHGAGAIAFDALSGGTREQLAAAVRLAMAEVLAADHNGCLPVVFDDSFAYSDPQRVRTLQDMLDLAARRGIQIIVLTCNPADYANLGAREVSIRAEPIRIDAATDSTAVEIRTENSRSRDQNYPPTSFATVEVTDAQRQHFLTALRAAGGRSGNTSLRALLGLDEATYDAVKRDLIARGDIVPGKGRGGSVALAVAPAVHDEAGPAKRSLAPLTQ